MNVEKQNFGGNLRLFFFCTQKKNDIFPGKWIVRCFLQQIFMDVILDLENV